MELQLEILEVQTSTTTIICAVHLKKKVKNHFIKEFIEIFERAIVT